MKIRSLFITMINYKIRETPMFDLYKKKPWNLNECIWMKHRINSANNHHARQGRKKNDRNTTVGRRRRRRKDEWKERNSADHSLWLCSWLSRSSSFIHASTVPSMVFLPCGFMPLFIEAYYFIATRLWMHFAHAVVQRKVFRPSTADLRCSLVISTKSSPRY